MRTSHLLILFIIAALLLPACGPGGFFTPLPTATPDSTPTPAPTENPSPTPGIGTTRTSEKDGMLQVFVPAGEFVIGSTEVEVKNYVLHCTDARVLRSDCETWYNNEKPAHTVYLDSFWIDRTEVTNSQYAQFARETGYKTDAENAGYYDPTQSKWVFTEDATWRRPRGQGSDIDDLMDHPVVLVSWYDAHLYCNWAGRRLPTDAEWEKAARGTDGRTYPWGSQPPAGNLLNFADKNFESSWSDPSVDDGYQYTSPVGRYPDGTSPYGALDMSGNVWEMVADYFYESDNRESPAQNPTDPDFGNSTLVRGGSWRDYPGLVRSANRNWLTFTSRNNDQGFRCASSHSLPGPAGTSTVAASPTPAPTPAVIPSMAFAPTPTPDIGSIRISEKDGMTQVYVPEGEFRMGTPGEQISSVIRQCIVDGFSKSDCEGWFKPEQPLHTVKLNAFWIDRTEVTNSQYAHFARETGYKTGAEMAGWGYVHDGREWVHTSGADWQHPAGPGSSLDGLDNHPVVQVSWYDAALYCDWAGRRLPTEAEWEKAARGTDGHTYPWGDHPPDITYLNYAYNVEKTMVVGSYSRGASPYGTLDMAGNVWEWVADWYGPYSAGPQANPSGSASLAHDTRVLRGGSWTSDGWGIRSAYRNSGSPDISDNLLGFRCAVSP